MFPAKYEIRDFPDYYNARKMQAILCKVVCDEKTPARDAAQCTRAWIELERLKREIRGLPPLAAASLADIVKFKRDTMKHISNDSEPMELDLPEVIEN